MVRLCGSTHPPRVPQIMINPTRSSTAVRTTIVHCDDHRHLLLRYDRWIDYDDTKNIATTRRGIKYRRSRRSLVLGSASASASPRSHIYQQVLKAAREKFTQEISFQFNDNEISLAKALLYVAAEDEAFLASNREMDAYSIINERKVVCGPSGSQGSHEWSTLEEIPLAGRNISEWQTELDSIAKQVQVELISRDKGCHLTQVLEAVNVVLFELRGFRRSPVVTAAKYSYLHLVLSSGCGIAILLSIIYIEVCRRLSLNIVGSQVGEEFFIWPQMGNPEELFKGTSGHSLFSVVNGGCVEDSRLKASDFVSPSLSGLKIATNRDIIGISLTNLIKLHWKHASRSNHGVMLNSPLRHIQTAYEEVYQIKDSFPLLRPQDLRLAILASERLLILQPHNWASRRDHGMMLYYNREYGKAVQELSIYMAFAPEEEAQFLEPFVEKLHLLRLESSWKPLQHSGQLEIT